MMMVLSNVCFPSSPGTPVFFTQIRNESFEVSNIEIVRIDPLFLLIGIVYIDLDIRYRYPISNTTLDDVQTAAAVDSWTSAL